MDCPCKEGRYGAFALVVSIYWALQCGGFAAMFNLVHAGTALGVWWAIWTGGGVLLLAQGVREALAHDDDFNGGSVLVSAGLIGLALWALAHRWFSLSDDWIGHASRVFWFGLLGGEAFNLWLNFRGRRHARPVPPPEPVEPPQRFGLRRSRRIEVVEDIEGRGFDADDLARLLARLGGNTHFAAPPIAAGSDGGLVPQIVHVPDENGELVPVRMLVPKHLKLPR